MIIMYLTPVDLIDDIALRAKSLALLKDESVVDSAAQCKTFVVVFTDFRISTETATGSYTTATLLNPSSLARLIEF